MIVFHQLLNLFYRIVAPNNPRGWIQVYIEDDTENKGKKHIFTDGMQKWHIQNIEFSAVPEDLAGRVHGLIFEIINYLKNISPIKAGETFGMQTHSLTVVGKMIPGEGERLKIVDVDHPASQIENAFPSKMLHTAIVAEVSDSHSTLPADKEIILLKRAIELFSGNTSKPIKLESELKDNPHRNGATAFQLIADTYAEQGNSSECVLALDMFCQLSPYDMKLYGKNIINAIKSNEVNPDDIRSKYWLERENKLN